MGAIDVLANFETPTLALRRHSISILEKLARKGDDFGLARLVKCLDTHDPRRKSWHMLVDIMCQLGFRLTVTDDENRMVG